MICAILALFAKIYGTVHLKTSAIKIVTNGFELCDYFSQIKENSSYIDCC